MGRAIPAVVGLIVIGIVVVGRMRWRRSLTEPEAPPAASQPVAARGPAYDDVRAMLKALPVKGWIATPTSPATRFGESWSDDVNVGFGDNGCNTRDDIWRRDLAELVVRPGTCYPQSGVMHDPYTGQTTAFTRGPDTSDAVQIDHPVAAQRGVPLRVRRPADRREGGLWAVGVQEREARDGRRAGTAAG